MIFFCPPIRPSAEGRFILTILLILPALLAQWNKSNRDFIGQVRQAEARRTRRDKYAFI